MDVDALAKTKGGKKGGKGKDKNTSLKKGCVHGDKCHEESPKSKNGGATGSVALFVYLKILVREGPIHVNLGQLGSKHIVKFSKGTWRKIKIRERKGSSLGIIQKCALHERNPCAPSFEERTHEDTLIQERCARTAAWDLAKKKNPQAREFRQMLAPTSK